jgi:thiopeptide-type bacteriocin biosynthesis protein
MYYKFYLGDKTSDKFLTDNLKPIIDVFFERNYIEKWFYIRYADPEPHLRVRFHLKKTKYISEISEIIYNELKFYIDNKVIHKIQIDTYKRELERYGINTIKESEHLFHLNSDFNINLIKYALDTEERWLLGMKYIDVFLDDCGFNLSQKRDLFQSLKTSFSLEFGSNKYTNKQISEKFRGYRSLIIKTFENSNDYFNKIMSQHTKLSQVYIKGILNKENSVDSLFSLNNLIDSFIHMHCNRLFQTKQRTHEWIVYDFLFRYYDGKSARIKFDIKEEDI